MARKNSAHIIISLVTIFAVQGAMAANTNSTTKAAIADYARPLSFEPNQGQTDKQVDFLAHGNGYGLFLSHAEAVMVLQHSAPAKPNSHSSPTLRSSAAVRLRPVGAKASTLPTALDEQSSKSNYFMRNVPEKWHTRIPNYAKVRYANVYPGVDMIYYGNQRQLEYDFVVSPGANPGSISLEFQGPSKAELDREGGVVMHTAAGDLRWHKPVAYQEVNGGRRLVECAYTRRGGQRLGFRLAAYDGAKPLIIDPVLVYSTYLGGGVAPEQGNAIAVDAYGAAYVTGFTNSVNFPIKNAFEPEYPASTNSFGSGSSSVAFVTKFNTAGQLVYSTYLGGSGFDYCPPNGCFQGDEGNGIAVDRYGNAYVTGDTASTDFPVKHAFQRSLKATGGASNAFVTKLNVTGSALVYSTYLGGSSNRLFAGDFGRGIAVDLNYDAYVTGFTTSTDFPTVNAFQATTKGASGDAFVTKFDAAGTALVYSTYLGGSGGANGSGIAVDTHGNAYVTGVTGSTDFPTKNAFQNKLKSFFGNAFVTKFGANGDSLVYSTYLGGSGDGQGSGDSSNGIAVDSDGNAYLTGLTVSTDFPTKHAFQNKLKSALGNAFVTKFSADGDSLVYSTYLGGSGRQDEGDSGAAIAVDALHNAYVTGFTSSTDFPVKDAFEPVKPGGGDNAFVTKFDAAGTALVYSSYLGGSIGAGDHGTGIAVDAQGNAYLTGSTLTGNFPTVNAFQTMPAGVFVTKVSAQ